MRNFGNILMLIMVNEGVDLRGWKGGNMKFKFSCDLWNFVLFKDIK